MKMASSDLPTTWQRVKLASIAKPVRRVIPVEPNNLYRTMGVKWWGLGAYERESKLGQAISASKMYAVLPGDLVINKIWVRHGSSAIVGDELDGCVVTADFPTFELDDRLVLREWLTHMFKTEWFWTACDVMSRGTSGRQRIDPKAYLEIEIPLPPLDEQRRIVARIEALAGRIAEAQGLQQEAADHCKQLVGSFLNRTYDSLVQAHGTKMLSELCVSITDGNHLTPPFVDVGVKFIFVGNVSSGHLHFDHCKYVTPDYYASIRPQRRPQQGDILYSAVGATLGVPAIVDTEEEFCFQRHVAILKLNRAEVLPQYIWYMLRSKKVFEEAWSKTTGSAQPTVPLAAIRTLRIPHPPLSEQQRIVTSLDCFQARTDPLGRLQESTGAELAALLPAVLDKAFRGEL